MSDVPTYVNALLWDARCARCLPEETQWEIQTYILAYIYGEFGLDPNSLAQRAKCLSCLGRRNLLELKAYLLTYLNGTYRFPNGMIDNARCFGCIPDGMQLDVQTYLFSQDPGWTGVTNPAILIEQARTFQALDVLTLLQIQIFILATIAEIDTDPNVLMEYAVCMRCVPDPLLAAIATQALEYMMPVPPTSPRIPLDPPPIDDPEVNGETGGGGGGRGGSGGRGGRGGGGGNGRGGGIPVCTDNLTSLIPVLTGLYVGPNLTTATAFIPRLCCKGGTLLISGSDDPDFGTGNIVTTRVLPGRIANYTTAPIDLSAGGYDYYRARLICNDGLISDWSNIIADHWMPLDTFQSYTNGVEVNGLNGGNNWDGAFVADNNLNYTLCVDDLESYTNGAAVAGLNGGTGWSGAYAT